MSEDYFSVCKKRATSWLNSDETANRRITFTIYRPQEGNSPVRWSGMQKQHGLAPLIAFLPIDYFTNISVINEIKRSIRTLEKRRQQIHVITD